VTCLAHIRLPDVTALTILRFVKIILFFIASETRSFILSYRLNILLSTLVFVKHHSEGLNHCHVSKCLQFKGEIVAVPKIHDVKTYAKTGGKAPRILNLVTDGSGDIRSLIALSYRQHSRKQSRREKSSPYR
jgi:hypothetical protein